MLQSSSERSVFIDGKIVIAKDYKVTKIIIIAQFIEEMAGWTSSLESASYESISPTAAQSESSMHTFFHTLYCRLFKWRPVTEPLDTNWEFTGCLLRQQVCLHGTVWGPSDGSQPPWPWRNSFQWDGRDQGSHIIEYQFAQMRKFNKSRTAHFSYLPQNTPTTSHDVQNWLA
jgi:hypothetical protein